LCMADVKRIMEEINRRSDNAHLVMGATIAESWQSRIGLTLIASRKALPEPGPAFPTDRLESAAAFPLSAGSESDTRLLGPAEAECGASRFVPPPPASTPENVQQLKGRTGSGPGGRGKSSSRRPQQ